MNVKNKLKSRASRLFSESDEEKESRDQDEEAKAHNLKTELFNIFQIGFCFCLLFGGYNTLAQLAVRLVIGQNPPTSV